MVSTARILKRVFLFCIIVSALVVTAVAADLSIGKVDVDTLRLREAPSQDAAVITNASMGEKVVILGTTNGWYQVKYGSQTGYMMSEYLIIGEASEADRKGTVTASVVNFRETPSLDGKIIKKLSQFTSVDILGVDSGWFKVRSGDSTGYIHPDYLTLGATASQAAGTRGEIVGFAKQFLGTKYTAGGRSPSSGFDCSGFVYYVFKNFGYTLNPGATSQMRAVAKISKTDLLPGDLVFFNSSGNTGSATHVGIAIGDNQFIHATKPGSPLTIDSLSSSYYSRTYIASGRVVQ